MTRPPADDSHEPVAEPVAEDGLFLRPCPPVGVDRTHEDRAVVDEQETADLGVVLAVLGDLQPLQPRREHVGAGHVCLDTLDQALVGTRSRRCPAHVSQAPSRNSGSTVPSTPPAATCPNRDGTAIRESGASSTPATAAQWVPATRRFAALVRVVSVTPVAA